MSAARPETGATDAQLDEAKRSINEGAPVPMTRTSEALVELIACHLVPPGSVIALAEHVVSTADREAIGRRLSDCPNCGGRGTYPGRTSGTCPTCQGRGHQATDADLARLERLGIGGEETT